MDKEPISQLPHIRLVYEGTISKRCFLVPEDELTLITKDINGQLMIVPDQNDSSKYMLGRIMKQIGPHCLIQLVDFDKYNYSQGYIVQYYTSLIPYKKNEWSKEGNGTYYRY